MIRKTANYLEKHAKINVNDMKTIMEEWGESTTSHGIPRIIQNRNRVIKYMWLCFFLASFSYCAYTIIKTCVQYAKFDTNISIKLVYTSPSQFPAISICNVDAFNYIPDKNYEFLNGILDTYNLTYGMDGSNNNITDPNQKIDRFLTKLKRIIANKYLNDLEFRKSLGFDLEKHMLLTCTYNKVECNASDFSYFWSNEYGNCYTFNGGKNALGNVKPLRDTNNPGSDYGLQMELLIGDPLYLAQYSKKSGIFLIAHNSTKEPSFITDGIDIATGLATYLTITKTQYTSLPRPYSDCLSNEKDLQYLGNYSKRLQAYMREINASYDQDLCYKLCFQDQLVDSCDCCDLNIPLIRNKIYCETNAQLDCLDVINKQFSSSSIESLCKMSCPKRCENTKYDINIGHIANYPTIYYYTQLLNSAEYYYEKNDNIILHPQTAYKVIKDNHELANKTYTSQNQSFNYEEFVSNLQKVIVKININFKDLTYTSIEDTPDMTFETLLGVVGGQLGLFIGVSFLSMIELFEVIIKIFWSFYKKMKISENGNNGQEKNGNMNANIFYQHNVEKINHLSQIDNKQENITTKASIELYMN